MGEHVVELVMAADVIAVSMGCNRRDGLVEQVIHGFDETGDAHPGVDDQISVTAPDVPDVAAHQLDDVRFPEQRDVVADRAPLEPSTSDRKAHRPSVRAASRRRR